MPYPLRHSIVLFALGASVAAASCGAPERHPPGGTESGSASGSSGHAGTSGKNAGGGGQLGHGATDASNAGAGGAMMGGATTAGATMGGATTAGASGTGAPQGGSTSHPPNFVKKRLNADFYSEGIHYGDLDRDGKRDIIAGPYFYPGPDYAEKRAFREPRTTPFPATGDSDCYSIFVHDLNQDGWPDILSSRLAGGSEAVWYENPKGAAGYWAEHVVFSVVDNESATFADIDGDGKPELVTLSNGYGGWAQPDWTASEQPWMFRRVTGNGNWPRYTHGLGVGDVNGDGRADLLLAEGWWEQPASPGAGAWVSHPAAFWGQQAAGESYGGAQMFTYDVDGDGDSDVVTSLQAHGWGLAWFEQTGASFVKHPLMSTRAEEAQYGVAFAQLHALDVADVDGDGLKDIVTGKRKGAHGNGLGAELNAPAVLYWFRLIREPGQSPRYEPHLLDSEAGVGTQVVVADVNEDGLPDILTAARAGAFLFLNQ
jgi:hypothetical protein